MGYTKSFLAGFTWSSGLKILSKVLSLIKIMILARILSKNDFGLFSLVLVAISLIEVFTETGINVIILQSSKPLSHFLNTAWLVSIGRGLLISAIIVLMSFPMTQFYSQPELLWLIWLAALVPIIRGFINPAIVSFHKELQFRKDTLYRFSLVAVDFLLSVILAVLWRNVYALIFPIVLTALFEVFFTFVFVKQKPRIAFSRSVFKEIFKSARWLNGIAVIDYLNKNFDDLIVGRLLGTPQLGLYRNGYALSQSTTAELGNAILHSSFPVYLKVKDDLPRFQRAYTKVLFGFGVFTFIPLILCLFFPVQITQIVLGKDWLEVAQFLPLLIIAGYLQGVINISSPVFQATKQYRPLLIQLAIPLVVMVTTIIPLSLQFGLVGAGFSILLSRIVVMPILLIQLCRVFHEKI